MLQKKIVLLENLKKRHRTLDNEIETLYKQRYNEERLHDLKKKKLDLKDRISKLEIEIGENNG